MRSDNDNDLTFVSTRGKSILDYLTVPYEHIENSEGLRVIRPAQIYGDTMNGVETRMVPDHSITACRYNLKQVRFVHTETVHELHNNAPEKRLTKYELSNIPLDLCNDVNSVRPLQALGHLEVYCKHSKTSMKCIMISVLL